MQGPLKTRKTEKILDRQSIFSKEHRKHNHTTLENEDWRTQSNETTIMKKNHKQLSQSARKRPGDKSQLLLFVIVMQRPKRT